MTEKFGEYPLDRPIDAERREKIEQFIAANAAGLGRPVSHEWLESGKVLVLDSDPVQWRLVFHPGRLEAFASAPLWVRLLFTEKRRKVARDVILRMIHEAGFADPVSPRRGLNARNVTARGETRDAG
jgi:hypothetical protein